MTQGVAATYLLLEGWLSTRWRQRCCSDAGHGGGRRAEPLTIRVDVLPAAQLVSEPACLPVCLVPVLFILSRPVTFLGLPETTPVTSGAPC